MTSQDKIGVLFNVTEKSGVLLKALREQHPDAHITAVVPVRAGIVPADMPDADELLPLELSPLRLIFQGTLLAVIRQMRERRFDLFILRFGTLKLRLLAARVAPGCCELWLIGGIIAPVNVTGIVPTTGEYFRWRCDGCKTRLKAWFNIHFVRVRPEREKP